MGNQHFTIHPMKRFFANVDCPGQDCWEWKGAKVGGTEYGSFNVAGKRLRSNRAAWLLLRGPIPDGLHVLHRCDNPPCCNPDHLFLGTQLDNIRDAIAKGRMAGQKKTHCMRGHEFSGKNKHGGRICRTCSNDRQNAKRVARRRSQK